MKTVNIWWKSINFISEIKTKHMRKLYPLFSQIENDEINWMIEVSKVLFIDIDWENDIIKYEEFIDNLIIPDLTEIMQVVGKIIEDWSKKK